MSRHTDVRRQLQAPLTKASSGPGKRKPPSFPGPPLPMPGFDPVPPTMDYPCEWWKEQTIVAPYLGEDANSFTLPELGQLTLHNYIGYAPKTGAEQTLWANIADVLKRVKQVLDYGPADVEYWNHIPGSKQRVEDFVTVSEAMLEEIHDIYAKFRVPHWTNAISMYGYRSEWEHWVGWVEKLVRYDQQVAWPLDKRLEDLPIVQSISDNPDTQWAHFYWHHLGHIPEEARVYLFDRRSEAKPNSPPLQGKGVLDYEQDGLNFEEIFGKMGDTLWMNRINAINDLRDAYEEAALAARCAEVWTAFVVSYGQNRQLWKKKKEGAGKTLNPIRGVRRRTMPKDILRNPGSLKGCLERMKESCGTYNSPWTEAYKKCVITGAGGCLKMEGPFGGGDVPSPGTVGVARVPGVPARTRRRARSAVRGGRATGVGRFV